jgi:hypothetical protein
MGRRMSRASIPPEHLRRFRHEVGGFRGIPGRRPGVSRRESASADSRFANNYSADRYRAFSHSVTWMR